MGQLDGIPNMSIRMERLLIHQMQDWKHYNTLHPNFARKKFMFILGYAQMDLVLLECSKTIFIVANNSYAVQTSTIFIVANNHFRRILVSGPKHPKRLLDVFLQPFIQDLKEL